MVKASAPGLLISAVALSVPVAIVLSNATPFHASANAAIDNSVSEQAAQRIGDAFASLKPGQVAPPPVAAAINKATDDSAPQADCAGAVWPNIDASCLSTADGLPVRQVRKIAMD